MSRVDSLYLSPHLDDVGFSCPARIHQERAEGRRVLVATVFSKGAPDESLRKREDRRAMRLLGATALHLDLPDAPCFDPRYRSFRSICLGPDRRDPRLLPALRRLLDEARPDRVYAPLGVGTHVDHRALHRAVRRLRPKDLFFYEDRPYAFLRHAVTMRMAEIGARVTLERPTRAAFLESLDRTAFLRAYLGADEREACLRILLRRLGRRSSGRRKLRPLIVTGPLDPAEAVALAYRSQAKDLFDGGFRQASLEYSRRLGVRGYAERLWK